ncbi:MAG: N-methyl-L-tryptophan oxidase [Planctomycetes bacterium]|nr:N-methyl-L-tryptophan oxidase [Planctomycetota bacterium]MBI3834611.1 N-methyl-L-tryptophan oxidase [Planctomycetota bacterium]
MSYDAIVIGLGGMGSATLHELARRGMRVMGLEKFQIAHDQGSSHGETRIIRRSYFEHPSYVPLVDRALMLWNRLEGESKSTLFHQTGLFLAGPAEGEVIAGTCRARDLFGLAIESISTADAAVRFPNLRAATDSTILFEADAGFLKVEDCVRRFIDSAVRRGAEVRSSQKIIRWEADGDGIRVLLDGESLNAARLALCCGPWSSNMLHLNLPLEVLRKPVFWFKTANPLFGLDRGCPIYGFESMGGFFYGFPSLDGHTVKIAEHTGREPVHPETVDRLADGADAARCTRFLAAHLPTVGPEFTRSSVCMYTMTRDQHFIVDRHPQFPQVALAAGFSGHGFKFAPVIAEMLANILTDDHFKGLELFSVDRPALNV